MREREAWGGKPQVCREGTSVRGLRARAGESRAKGRQRGRKRSLEGCKEMSGEETQEREAHAEEKTNCARRQRSRER